MTDEIKKSKAIKILSIIGIILGSLFVFLGLCFVLASETEMEAGISVYVFLVAAYLLAYSIVVKIKI